MKQTAQAKNYPSETVILLRVLKGLVFIVDGADGDLWDIFLPSPL